jgi:hypothetical protein
MRKKPIVREAKVQRSVLVDLGVAKAPAEVEASSLD